MCVERSGLDRTMPSIYNVIQDTVWHLPDIPIGHDHQTSIFLPEIQVSLLHGETHNSNFNADRGYRGSRKVSIAFLDA
jgi:hypothetical protein